MKRASMRLLVSASVLLVACLAGSAHGSRSTGQSSVAAHRTNELTLSGIRPGRDSFGRAKSKYKNPAFGKPGETPYLWLDFCRKLSLSVDTGPIGRIQTIRVEVFNNVADCLKISPSKWRTGLGLAIGDATAHAIQLYGQPDLRSASTRDGQQLELLHYNFEWAGPGVPQRMDVLCTTEKDGKPGRVVEIRLAASGH